MNKSDEAKSAYEVERFAKNGEKSAATPQTDLVESDILAEYRYCEAAFNDMAQHARDLERENVALKPKADLCDELMKALQRISEIAQKYRFEVAEREAYSLLTNIGTEASEALSKAGA